MYRLNVLGRLGLTAPTGEALPRVVAGDLRLTLLSYLALAIPGQRRRDTLMALFWPESDSVEARHRLRQVLYVLRSELGEDVLVTTGREQVGLNAARFWCDAVEFRAAIGCGRLEVAQSLYGGAFCEGLYVTSGIGVERWIEEERDRFEQQATDSAWRLARQCEAEGRLRAAAGWGARVVDLSMDEARLRWVLEVLERDGDRIGALRTFERFERRLAADYELAPSQGTLAIVHRLRGGGFAGIQGSARWPPTPPVRRAHREITDSRKGAS